MDTFQHLKILHDSAVLVAFVAALGLAFYGWRSWRRGDAGGIARSFLRIGLIGWVLVAGSVVSLPITGWQLVHMVGWPLGQTWLLASAGLLVVATIFWLLFTARLWRIRDLAVIAQSSGEPLGALASRHLKFGLAFLGLALLTVGVILGLMIAKPV